MTGWMVRDLQDREQVAGYLALRRLSRETAHAKADLFARSASVLIESGVSANSPAIACFVPGRVEVLGKHTDYAGGHSMVAAVERGFCVVAAAREDPVVRMTDAKDQQKAEFVLASDLTPRNGHWSNYPMTVARRIARNFPGELQGADVAFASDLPPAAGMSSSSAMIVSSFLVLSDVNGLSRREPYVRHIQCREDLAGYLGTVENGQSFGELAGDLGVGTFGGSQDHTAILCAQAGRISQYVYCPVRLQRMIDLSDDHLLAFASSGVFAEKTGRAKDLYNRVSQRASAAMDVWREVTGRDDANFASALRCSPDAADRFRDALRCSQHPEFKPSELLDRFDQFYAECEEIIPAVPERLTRSTMEQFAHLVDRSQSLGTQCLGNQVPETVFLANAARELGAAAASAFGAGFGGSVWALVEASRAETMMAEWSRQYGKAFPQHANGADFFTSRLGPGAFMVDTPDNDLGAAEE